MGLKDLYGWVTGNTKRAADAHSLYDAENEKRAKAAQEQADAKFLKDQQDKVDRENSRRNKLSPSERLVSSESRGKIREYIDAGRPPRPEKQPKQSDGIEATRLEHTFNPVKPAPVVNVPGQTTRPNSRAWHPRMKQGQSEENENVPRKENERVPQVDLTAEMSSPLSPQEQEKWRKGYGEQKVTLHTQYDRERTL
jgi:hypothetical protein